MDIPEKLADEVASGKVIRYGAILKDVNTGRIVGHLKESKDLINLVSKVPVNPVQMVSGVVECASSLAANYQIHQQGIKIDYLATQVKNLTGVVKFAATASSISAIASIGTFALCAAKFKAIDDRLRIIEKKTDTIIEGIEAIRTDNEKRELRQYLTQIKGSFDYLLPTSSKTRVENIQGNLSTGFVGIHSFLKYKAAEAPQKLNLDDVMFLYNVLVITAMGELRGFAILDDAQGAKHLLNQRSSDLIGLKDSFLNIANAANDSKLPFDQIGKKCVQLENFVTNLIPCYANFDSQRLIVSEYIENQSIGLKKYYEEIEDDEKYSGIRFISH